MMISPEAYVLMHKDDSFEELIKERKNIQREIARLEKIVFNKDKMSEEWMMAPGPDVEYQTSLEYLSKLCTFICEKYNQEIIYGEEK